jgi:hypothetical protein
MQTSTRPETKASRFLDSLATTLESRAASGDPEHGVSKERLEKAANLYRYQAEMVRRGK